MPLLTAKAVWFRYDKNDNFVLRDASFSIGQGEIHAVVGGNGSGKTTLLRLLCGALKLNRGKLTRRENVRCGLLSQNPKSLLAADTVTEELAEWQKEYGYGEQDIKEKMKAFGLTHLAERHPYDLSGGEMQKTALAKILLLNPDVLLLDEPVKGLDAPAREELVLILRRLKKEGKSVVLVTHARFGFCRIGSRPLLHVVSGRHLLHRCGAALFRIEFVIYHRDQPNDAGLCGGLCVRGGCGICVRLYPLWNRFFF